MKIDFNRAIKSTTEEIVDIHIEWSPTVQEEEGLAALIVTLVDLVQRYNRLNTLASD